ncbi:uncharacterized protein DS421_3g82800 [Arachis hypogaea]|nr:uncharacterized protein DS421_3g82800 [Arachis hypogaea]
MESWVSSICDTEIPLQLRKIDYLATSFSKSLQSLKSTAHQTAQFKGNWKRLKVKLEKPRMI